MSSKTSKQGASKKAAPRQNQVRQSPAAQNSRQAVAGRTAQATAERSTPLTREQRQAQARAVAAQRRRAANLKKIGIFAALAVVLLGTWLALYLQEANKPGQLVAQQASRPHVQPGQSHPDYITDPPTSGPHVGQVPDFKVYSEPITKELQVHGLEDGGVAINYRPDLDKTTVDRLAALATSYIEKGDPNPPSNLNARHPNRLLMAPYDFKDKSDVIVLTAWRRIERFPTYDEAGIRRFIDEYIGIDSHAASDNGDRIPGLDGP